jgi:glyoxylate carboligase
VAGVNQVFGYPEDGINTMLAAWGRAGNESKFVEARHGEMAAFEAIGYAKFCICSWRWSRAANTGSTPTATRRGAALSVARMVADWKEPAC